MARFDVSSDLLLKADPGWAASSLPQLYDTVSFNLLSLLFFPADIMLPYLLEQHASTLLLPFA
jgi:hypothetical protein